MTDLPTRVADLHILADDLLDYIDTHPASVADLDAWLTLREAQTLIINAVRELEAQIAGAIPKGEQVADGQGRRWKWGRDQSEEWDDDALLRAVLDSRLVDPATGEVRDESPLDRVRAVWPLRGRDAWKTALRARSVDPDEFRATSPGRVRLREVRPAGKKDLR